MCDSTVPAPPPRRPACIRAAWAVACAPSVHAQQPPSPPAGQPQSQPEAPAPAAPSAQPPAPASAAVNPPELSPDDPLPPTGIEEELALITPGVALKRQF